MHCTSYHHIDVFSSANFIAQVKKHINVLGLNNCIPQVTKYFVVLSLAHFINALLSFCSLITHPQPPIMCPYQMAKYDVIISDFTAGVQLAKTSITHTYGDGGTFDIGLTFVPVIKEERTYYVILSVNSFDFASLQAFASFSMSKC